MGEALKELASSGTIGAAFVVVLFMLFWMVKVLIASFVKQTEAVIKAMNELVDASRAIRDNCQVCRQDSVASLRDAQSAIVTKIEQVVAASHDKAGLETATVVRDAVEKLDSTITDAANSIRSGNKQLVQEMENQRLRDEVEISRSHNIDPHESGVVRR
jgi:F0F1-type ATP synthase membrane subunit b/b'